MTDQPLAETLGDGWLQLEQAEDVKDLPIGQQILLQKMYYAGASVACKILARATREKQFRKVGKRLLVELRAFIRLTRAENRGGRTQ